MDVINQKKNLNFGENNSPEISLNSNLKRWFSRNIGLWKSNRTYFLDEMQKTYNLCMNINIQALENKSEWESHYKFTWYPEKKYNFFEENPQYKERGEMRAFLKGHQLMRENFYLSNDQGISNIRQVDEHEMIFESSYKDWYILEHTRLVDSDNFRFRVIYSWNKNKLKIVAIDFGIKKSILNRLVSHGCEIVVLPSQSSLKDVLSYKPDGIFFSNGPGDPSSVSEGIELARSLIEHGKIPMFGICLGHQIFGLALGGSTYKLPFGHRGLNHPCGENNKIEITSQNHGFAIDPNSLSKDIVRITHYNLNDNTVAGLEVHNKPIFSVQYHPEAGPGPHDSDYLFKKFVSLMLEKC